MSTTEEIKAKDPESVDPKTAPTEEPKKKRGRPKSPLKGSLVPDLSGGEGIADKRWYWCGTFPTCPNSFAHVGAATFSAVTYRVSTGENGQSTQRSGRIGCLMHLAKHEVEAIAETLRRSIVRFDEGPVAVTHSGLDAMRQKRRRGHIYTIPSQEEIEVRTKNGNPTQPYTRGQWDEPLAAHLFMVPCEDQKNPQHGYEYPPSLAEQDGIDWPS